MTNAIDYAPRQHWYKRKRLRRALIWLLIITTLAACAWQFGPKIYQRGRLLYWQRQCLNYVSPPPPATAPSHPTPPSELTNFISCLPPTSPLANILTPPPGSTAPGMLPAPRFISMHTLQRNGRQRLCLVFQPFPNINFFSDAREDVVAVLAFKIKIVLIEPATLFHDPAIIFERHLSFIDPAHTDSLLFPDLEQISVDPADKSVLLIKEWDLAGAAGTAPPATTNPLLARLRLSESADAVELTFEPTP